MNDKTTAVARNLEQIVKTDPASLARTNDLDKDFEFSSAVPTASKLVHFYETIDASDLDDTPAHYLSVLETETQQVIEVFNQIAAFRVAAHGNPVEVRNNILASLQARYEQSFNNLAPLVAYMAARRSSTKASTARVQRLITESSDQIAQQLEGLTKLRAEAEGVLESVRELSGAAGVGGQAQHFSAEASKHEASAKTWLNVTIGTGIALVVFAILSWWVGNTWPPKTTYQSINLSLSKLLIFSTIASFFFLSARTLAAHRHNAVVNRHRENALSTFNVLANAATSDQTREVVLTHASACIYEPQDSGFTKASNSSGGSIVEVLPRLITPQSPHAAS